MDFIEGLTKSLGKTTILVVVDRLTKFGHFIPLSHPFTAQAVAATFIEYVYRLYGMPKVMVSDRDGLFTSGFWQELWNLHGQATFQYLFSPPKLMGKRR